MQCILVDRAPLDFRNYIHEILSIEKYIDVYLSTKLKNSTTKSDLV